MKKQKQNEGGTHDQKVVLAHTDALVLDLGLEAEAVLNGLDVVVKVVLWEVYFLHAQAHLELGLLVVHHVRVLQLIIKLNQLGELVLSEEDVQDIQIVETGGLHHHHTKEVGVKSSNLVADLDEVFTQGHDQL